ncbi:MAG: SGNH/GDSL hydrolase family protein [Balneolales bacterium]
MNHSIFITIGIAFILFSIPQHSQAQDKSDVKTDQEILEEYERWSGMRDDWPNLSNYREANQQLGLPEEGEDRVVFMGNSITIGWSNLYPEYFEGKPYVNRGIGGQTTPQMLNRFRQDVIDLQPKLVIILAGTNDIAGNTGPATDKMILDNISSMAELAQAHDIDVILSSILPVYNYPWKPGLEPAARIISLNEDIKVYAEEHNLYYLDYFSSVVDERDGMKKELASDGVHPNENGYKVMSGLAEEAIRDVLKN